MASLILENEKTKDCSICLEEITEKNCCVTECNHLFHLKCLLKAMTKNNCCPMCRYELIEVSSKNSDSEDSDYEESDYEDSEYNSYEGNNELFISVVNDNFDEFKLKIEELKKNNIPEEFKIILNEKDGDDKNAFTWAIFKDKLDIAKLLHDEGIDTNIVDHNDYTSLMHSVLNNDLETVVFLISLENIDVNTKNDDGDTALMLACEESQLNIVKELIKANANPNIKNKKSVYALLLIESFDILAELLVIPNIDVNAQDYDGNTLLHNCLSSDFSTDSLLQEYIFDNPELLLKNPNTDLNIKNNNGDTILMFAIQNESLKFIEFLLAENVNINIQNIHGNTALIIAVNNNNIDIVNMLLENEKIDISIKNNDGHSALEIAIEYSYDEIQKKLTEFINK